MPTAVAGAPHVDFEAISAKSHAPPFPPPPPEAYVKDVSPLAIQAIATLSVALLLVLCFFAVKGYLAYQQRKFLADLPESDPNCTWLVIAFEWDEATVQAGRMPLEGIGNIQDLITAAAEYGADAVDPDIRDDNVDVKYMDAQGVERRVGAKTRYVDVRQARCLRVTRRAGAPKSPERGGLMPSGLDGQKRSIQAPMCARDLAAGPARAPALARRRRAPAPSPLRPPLPSRLPPP